MKRISKILICLLLCVFAFGIVGCGKKGIMHPDSNAVVSSNGGLAVSKGEYIYFVNGFISADSMTERDAKYNVGSIIVAKLDANGNPSVDENGSLNSNAYATVSTKLSGFEATSLNIFGDYLYFTSPCQENQNGEWAKGLVLFYRVKLNGKEKAQKIYQSVSNNGHLNFAYYNDGANTTLIVHEKSTQQLVLVNASNKNKQTIENINNTVMPTNNSQYLVYVSNVENKFEVHKFNLATKEDVKLATQDQAITIKFVNEQNLFFEKSNEYGGDVNLFYLPLTSSTIEDASLCWESVNNLSTYSLSQDGKTLIGVRGKTIQYKYNWQLNLLSNTSVFSSESDAINFIGTTNNSVIYYDGNKTIKLFNFSSANLTLRISTLMKIIYIFTKRLVLTTICIDCKLTITKTRLKNNCLGFICQATFLPKQKNK